MSDGGCPLADSVVMRRAVAIALGAAVFGSLGAWLYLRASGQQDRTLRRIDALRQRLDALADHFARYAAREQHPAGDVDGS